MSHEVDERDVALRRANFSARLASALITLTNQRHNKEADNDVTKQDPCKSGVRNGGHSNAQAAAYQLACC